MLARIQLENLTEKSSVDFPGFVDRLLQKLPGLGDHHCGKGRPGGFVERLHSGTYFAHIVEHIAIELATSIGAGGNFGRTVYADEKGRYDIIVEYKNEPGCRYLIATAVEFVSAVLAGDDYPLAAKLDEARRILEDAELGPSTRAIIDAAEQRGIPWSRLNDGSLVQLGYGKYRKLIKATETQHTSAIAVDIACDKHLTKQLLNQATIPTPRGTIVRTRDEAIAEFRRLDTTVAVKPLDSNQGKGVSLRLTTAEEVASAFDLAASYSNQVIIEEFLDGRDYRVLIVNGKMVAASERVPAHVVGDGHSTIAQLVERENQNPSRGNGHVKPLTCVALDDQAKELLGRSGLAPEHILSNGKTVFLRTTANLSTGGTARDVTDKVHPEVVTMCERAARLIGLDICGVDLITPDITAPIPEKAAGIIEVNAAPGIRMHHHPSEGKPRAVGSAIVDMLYPAGSPSRVPIISITGTNGKTTVTRMISHAIGGSGRTVGMTTTDGIYIGGERVAAGDLTGSQSARTVLSDPIVEVAVLETARGGIIRGGLGYDWSDVAVLTNIQPDHLGQDGIETLDDLLFVKSLIAERVREGGDLILNADDERLAHLIEIPRVNRIPKNVVYFSVSDNNPAVGAHLTTGGMAFFVSDGWIIEAQHGCDRVARLESFPVTLGGTVTFQVANLIAAFAACRVVGLTRKQAIDGLTRFKSTEHNHGRMNIYQVRQGYVVIDYGHNVGAFAAFSSLCDAWPRTKMTGIVTAPGDRTDELIAEVGRLAAKTFDKLIVREDEDLRGRRAGEIAQLIYEAAVDQTPDIDCCIVTDEREALRRAVQTMEPGEIVMHFYEKHREPCIEVLRKFNARRVDAIEPQLAPRPISA